MSKLISIICPYTNKEVLQMLIDSLNMQKNQNYELVLVNSKEHGFTSASQTLNYGASLAKGDIYVFCHQDIEFINSDAIDQIFTYCNNYDFAIAGVAGATSNEPRTVSKVLDGPQKVQVGKEIFDVEEAEALDECLFIIKKENFKGFDDLGKTWHFYSVDYCLNAIEKNEKVLVLPIPIYHLSNGKSLNPNYYTMLVKLGKKHKKIKLINTTCLRVKNNWTLRINCFLRKLKFQLITKRKLKD